MNRAIIAYQVLPEPVAGLAGLGALAGLAEPLADVQQIMAGVEGGQIHPATDIRLQIELRSKARKSRDERKRLKAALRQLPGFYDPAERGEPGISGKRHWEISLPAGELWNLGKIPHIGTVRLAPAASQIAFFQPDAPRIQDYAPRDGWQYPWRDVWAKVDEPDEADEPGGADEADEAGGVDEPGGLFRDPFVPDVQAKKKKPGGLFRDPFVPDDDPGSDRAKQQQQASLGGNLLPIMLGLGALGIGVLAWKNRR